jgi:hypothetical protein
MYMRVGGGVVILLCTLPRATATPFFDTFLAFLMHGICCISVDSMGRERNGALGDRVRNSHQLLLLLLLLLLHVHA